eukprot:550931-Pyramimonas_sp.AAC.1
MNVTVLRELQEARRAARQAEAEAEATLFAKTDLLQRELDASAEDLKGVKVSRQTLSGGGVCLSQRWPIRRK